ncbi:MAG: alpha/beta fold hydrolase [Chloroflexota bacterium]|nr:alpha/beta fold hydrolase [Chloroflexota bacterium]
MKRRVLPLLLSVVQLLLWLSLLGLAPRAQRSGEEYRPVVLVHGFGASSDAWHAYLGPDGYLATVGLEGYAVGDGQVEGTLNTGSLTNPLQRTNTIEENARILGDYISNVKRNTGAEQVDLVAHSMGGLISRYYIHEVMDVRDVAQLIMLGSPQGGTSCAILPSSLNFHLPATLELRPDYIHNVFNRQVTRRKQVPFYIVAGDPIRQPIQSPCTEVPSDIVISLESASGIEAEVRQVPVLHTDLNTSREVFEEEVKPLLLRATDEIAPGPEREPERSQAPEERLQFTRVYTGHVDANTTREHTIHIEDNIAVASFGLFDPTRSLTVTVRGATGNIIALDPITHGLRVVDDPESLVYLGYGFENPRPGPWKVTLQATGSTPPRGADYAITARLEGGALLEATSDTLVPEVGEEVDLALRLSLGAEVLPLSVARATIQNAEGQVERMALNPTEGAYHATWTPAVPGLYGIDIAVQGTTEEGTPIERSAFLSVYVQPVETRTRAILSLFAIALALLVVAAVARQFLRRLRGRRT